VPLNTIGQNEALKSGTGGGVSGAVTHICVFTASDPGTGTNFTGTEATGGSPAYARQAVTWGTAASGQLSNTNALTFDVPPGTYGFFGLMTAATGNTNNYRGYLPFGGSVKGFGTADTADVTANTVTSAAHGLAANDRVMFFNVFAESLPAGLTEGTLYYVIATGLTADVFSVSTTQGGAAVDITGVGDFFWQKVVPETFAAQGQITVAAGQLLLDASTM
jgi:hypothetical protein